MTTDEGCRLVKTARDATSSRTGLAPGSVGATRLHVRQKLFGKPGPAGLESAAGVVGTGEAVSGLRRFGGEACRLGWPNPAVRMGSSGRGPVFWGWNAVKGTKRHDGEEAVANPCPPGRRCK